MNNHSELLCCLTSVSNWQLPPQQSPHKLCFVTSDLSLHPTGPPFQNDAPFSGTISHQWCQNWSNERHFDDKGVLNLIWNEVFNFFIAKPPRVLGAVLIMAGEVLILLDIACWQWGVFLANPRKGDRTSWTEQLMQKIWGQAETNELTCNQLSSPQEHWHWSTPFYSLSN